MISPRSRAGGFSLVEIAIASMVIAIALFGVLSMTLHNSRMKESLREMEVAKESAMRKIEEIRGLPWGTVSGSVIPSVCFTYAKGVKLPREVIVAKTAPFSVDGLNSTTTVDKKGQGRVFIHGTNPDSTNIPLADPVFLVDYEVLIEWVGVNGHTKYSTRLMLARDQGK